VRFLSRVWAITWKDLQSDFRTKEMLSTMLIFALLVVVIFSFAFDPGSRETAAVFPGLLWVAFFFAGLLGLNRSFVNEHSNDALQGLMLLPADRSIIYFGKVGANLVLMLIVEAVTLPVFAVFYNTGLPERWPLLLLVLPMATFGFIAVGTFLAALSANTRASEMLLPIILFPIAIPLILSAVEVTAGVFAGGDIAVLITWLKIIAVYDLVFLVVPFLLFEYVLDV